MTTSLDSTPHTAADPTAPAAPLPPPPVAGTPVTGPSRPPHKRSFGHIAAIVIGCFMLLPGLGMLIGGGAVALGQAVATDDDGYFRFTVDPIESTGVAVTTDDVWFNVEDEDWPWVLDWLDLDIRLRVDGSAATDEVFVGIARAGDVQRYLAGAPYTSVIELNDHTPEYQQVRGERRVAPPTEQDFWAVSSSGLGEQEVTWAARGGRWAIVVMNADGTPDVSADVEIGAKSGAVAPIAITLLIVGGVITLAGVALIIVGVRGRRDRDGSSDPAAWDQPVVMDGPPITPI